MASDDEEENVGKCCKLLLTIRNFGFAFFRMTCGIMAFDTAQSKEVHDRTQWVQNFEVQIWNSTSAHPMLLLQLAAFAGLFSFFLELLCVMVNFADIPKLLKYMAVINLACIVLVVFPICAVGFADSMEIYAAGTKLSTKVGGPAFKAFAHFDNVMRKVSSDHHDASMIAQLLDGNNRSISADVSGAQQAVDWMQQHFQCCGMNSVRDWLQWYPPVSMVTPNGNESKKLNGAPLHWWDGCSKATNVFNRTLPLRCNLPHSCCHEKHKGPCHPHGAYPAPCKALMLQKIIRCIFYSYMFVALSAILGLISNSFYYYMARRDELSNRETKTLLEAISSTFSDD